MAAAVRRGIEELHDARFRRETFSHLGPADPDSLPMNDPNFSKSEALRFVEVIGQSITDVLRPKRMKVERILDGYAPHPNLPIQNLKSFLFPQVHPQIAFPFRADGVGLSGNRDRLPAHAGDDEAAVG